jgi:transcription initiation factor TFIIB
LVAGEDEIDHGPEWRAFDESQRQQKTRVGAPLTDTLHDKGLSTEISHHNQDAHGNALSPEKCARMGRLRTWNERYRVRDSADRTRKEANGEINRMHSALGLPDGYAEQACRLFKTAHDAGMLPGRSIEGVASASLLAVCRITDLPQTIYDIARVARIDEPELGRTYRYLNRELELPAKPTDPRSLLPKLATRIDRCTDDHEREARRLLDAALDSRTGEQWTAGKSPTALAAAAIYLASQRVKRLTQTEIADACDVTCATIRNRHQELDEIVSIG